MSGPERRRSLPAVRDQWDDYLGETLASNDAEKERVEWTRENKGEERLRGEKKKKNPSKGCTKERKKNKKA